VKGLYSDHPWNSHATACIPQKVRRETESVHMMKMATQHPGA
jgi:hypothetical protein